MALPRSQAGSARKPHSRAGPLQSRVSGIDAGFPRTVYETLRRDVGWGETVSYGELAEMAGRPLAARAVGNALSRNPVPIVVPCHRVVAAGGRIGGYGPSGVATKQFLLALEGVELPA